MKLLLAALAAWFNVSLPDSPQQSPASTSESVTTTVIDSLAQIEYQDRKYAYTLTEIENLQKLSLHLNLPAKESSDRLANTHSCSFLINGGFYSLEDEPIGWFKNYQLDQPEVRSSLLDGRINLMANKVNISTKTNLDSAIGLQTGPLLIMDSKPQTLKIKNDEYRRRAVMLKPSGTSLYFLMVLGTDSLLDGPMLAELPQIVSLITAQEDLTLESAINLDGGSASTFYTQSLHIPEMNPIGSFFCYSATQTNE